MSKYLEVLYQFQFQPTVYRQVTDRLPTVGRHVTDSRLSVDRQIAKTMEKTVGRQSVEVSCSSQLPKTEH